MGLFGPPNIEKLKVKRNVKKLIKALCYKKAWRIRKCAAEALGEIKDARAVEPLIAALGDEDKDVRERAAEALGEIGDARAVEPLIAALKKDKDKDVREAAAEALEKISKPAVEPLIDVLKNKKVYVRMAAAYVLGKIRDARAVEPLIDALKHDKDVREAAAYALGKIKDARAVEPLIAALKDKDEYVREEAACALRQMELKPSNDNEKAAFYLAKREWDRLVKLGKPAVKPLIAALKDKDWDVREGAAKALGKIGWKPSNDNEKAAFYLAKREWDKLVKLGKPAVKPLIAAFKDKDWDLGEGAAKALGIIGDAGAVEPLIAALKDKDEDEDLREEAAKALGKIKDARAVEPLIDALKSKDEWIRGDVAEALTEIGKPAVEPLIATLKYKNPDIRAKATEALGKIKDTRAVDSLIAALKDKHEDVREKAGKALKEIAPDVLEELKKFEPCLAFYIFNSNKISAKVSAAYGAYAEGELLKALSKALKPDGGWIAITSPLQGCHGDLIEESMLGETPATRVLGNWLRTKIYDIDTSYLDSHLLRDLEIDLSLRYIPYAVGIGAIKKLYALKAHKELKGRNSVGYLGMFTLSKASCLADVASDLHLPIDMKIRRSKCKGWLASRKDLDEAGLKVLGK